ncbi:class I SAM-dependent methyltransferase [Chryseobacterium sp. Ch-15]|uniref:Class I SAM-dependent methyltransferase n=1 Tax=Chryseobacterium muglaense TaxID=2893752 RepID=A0A9Q3V057_9FLAO|nr:methyltransferase domain-containing protein [Chryseobacterium muglaense]MBD3906858.1 methyltransferase domain-containing protein [Chryseobacterium muglaense]MCC9036706.1 class I SAM-dependent methyltransferase [Chryseobacterium muglaense]MCM2555341.1 class I SAM-dependent methyltransferase [Chryseobacterium muglaense]
MKITKLVILFNYQKILLGIIVSIVLFGLSFFINSSVFVLLFRVLSVLIILNIIASLVASYILYDNSDLYELNNLKGIIDWNKTKNTILVHASFDPLSKNLEEKYPNLNLTVCDVFGNRHEQEKGIETSKKIFPPNPKEIKIKPHQLPFEDCSQDVILAITALHEILDHDQRVLFFQEAKRVLKNDGLIIVSEQFRDFINFVFFNIGAFHFLSKKKWKKAISEAGLEIAENKKITPFANMLIVRK